MNEQIFKERTKKLALDTIQLVEELPNARTADVIGRQMLRCGTSVGANYRAACRGKSIPDVLAKLAIVEEEADETAYWLELLIESGIVSADRVQPLLEETNAITAMIVSSIKTLRTRLERPPSNPKAKIENKGVSFLPNPKSKIQNPK